MVWFFVVGADQMDMSMTIPIEVLNLPKNLVIYNQYQKEVAVTLRGPRSIMQELRNRNTSLPLDLSKVEPGTIVLNADSLPIPLPSGISILRMQPASITLSIDQLVEKQIPIIAAIEGAVSSGYILKQLSLNPDIILVSGPQQLISRQQSLKTYVINLNGVNQSSTLPVRLDLEPDLMDLIGETTVIAKITVTDKFIEKKVRKIPINTREADQSIRIKPDSISVVASIPERLTVDTPVLSMLFRASINVGSGALPRKVPVSVTGVTVPGHEPIKVLSHSPLEVEIFATGKIDKNTTVQDKKKS
jgi:YbbR domain-containing protein